MNNNMSFKEKKKANMEHCKRWNNVFNKLTKTEISQLSKRVAAGEQFIIEDLEKMCIDR